MGGANYAAIGEINMANLVHGEQMIRLHQPIPVEGTVSMTAKVTGIYDKGSGMVIVTESESVLKDTGEPLLHHRELVVHPRRRWLGWRPRPERAEERSARP